MEQLARVHDPGGIAHETRHGKNFAGEALSALMPSMTQLGVPDIRDTLLGS